MLVLEDSTARAPAGRADLRGARRARPRLRGVSSDGARAGRAAGRGVIARSRCSDARRQRRRGRPRQRARHRDAAERRGRGARLPARLRRARARSSGHVDQVDDRPLPRRRRRRRGGGAGADDRARRDPADDPSRGRPTRLRRRRRRQRGARTAVALRRLDVAGVRRQRLGARDSRLQTAVGQRHPSASAAPRPTIERARGRRWPGTKRGQCRDVARPRSPASVRANASSSA